MSDEYLESFARKLPQMSDADLLRTVARFNAAPAEFRAESVAAANAEVGRRRLSPGDLEAATDRLVEDAVRSVAEEAADLAEAGRSQAQIAAHLKAGGLNQADATAVAARAWNMPVEQRLRAGRRNMMSGVGLCGLALLVPLLSFIGTGGTRAAVFWPVMLAGVVQFLRGAKQRRR